MSRQIRPKTGRKPAVAWTLAFALTAALTSVAAPAGPASAALPLGASVVRTNTGPTGYEVTIRYSAPAATQVEVYGEWAFAGPTAGPGSALGTAHAGGAWQPGDVPSGGSWWYAAMEGPDSAGVWTYTTPLPPGMYSYGFFEDCPAHTGTCRRADPAALPWSNQPAAQAANAAQQTMSQVYVPADPNFTDLDASYLDNAGGPKGTVQMFEYASPESTSPAGIHRAAVYLPAGYDPNRAQAYPTLYISHGGGGNETDWTTQGGAQRVLDNAINAGELQPAVAVFPNFNGLPNGNDGYRADVTGNLIPAVEAAFNVSAEAADRAFAGLSAGGSRAYNIVENQADAFGYYGIWSMGGAITPLTPDAMDRLGDVAAIHFGCGYQDISGGVSRASQMADRAVAWRGQLPGLNLTEHYVDAVHSWDLWRLLLDEFVRDVAFATTTVTAPPPAQRAIVTGLAVELQATVAAFTSTAQPTGQVRFYAGGDQTAGQLIGSGPVDATGLAVATAVFPSVGTDIPVIAYYEGDSRHGAAASAPYTVTVGQPAASPLNLGPTIKYTGAAPTGYEVTFRYQAPASVASVQIYGEWYFSQPSSIVNGASADLRLGKDWLPGDVPAGVNNAWRAEPMQLGSDGIWTFTTPLPSGAYSYRYYHNCASVTGSGCTAIADPANLPWSNTAAAAAQGAGQQALSQVYVPSSAKFPTYANEYQAPPSAAGAVRTFWYYPAGSSGPGAYRNAMVYLPPGYDANRAAPYPTLYISHGAGGNDTDWSTQGQIQNIAANAMADGAAQPMVIVAPNANGISGGNAGFAADLRDALIPAVEQAFNVSAEPEDRAFAGLSAGGSRAITLLHEYTGLFGYYGIWSAASTYTAPTAAQVERIKQTLGIQIGTGIQDHLAFPINVQSWNRVAGYRSLGIDVVEADVPGIHAWDVWRQQANALIREVAFKATGVEVLDAPGVEAWKLTTLKASVVPSSVSGIVPTGRVEFRVGSVAGELLGAAQLDGAGTATLSAIIHESGPVPIVAVYAGDALFNGSSGSRTIAVSPGQDNPLRLGSTVVRTGRAPTGYELTVRYLAPAAGQVEVYGEWSFAAPTAGPGSPLGAAHSGASWAPGDVPSGGAWWYAGMDGPDADGVWTYRVPLPTGVFSYGFYVDCPAHTAATCRRADPANLPWSNEPDAVAVSASQQTMSQVYVPADPNFTDVDYSFLDTLGGAKGTLQILQYVSPASTAPAGLHRAAVYLPPGYDPDRAKPYPTLYISHGGSGNETDWTTQGSAKLILDNAINSGELEPAVAVFPNFNGLPNGNDGYRADVTGNLIPAVQHAFNVSTAAADRAFAGLSAGGSRAINIIENQGDAFGYYGVWSTGGTPATLDAAALARLADVEAIQIGCGRQDMYAAMVARAASWREQIATAAVSEWYVEGVHSWDVWRQELNQFVREIAFKPPQPEPENPLKLGPTVKHTGKAPTGYEVTFRYRAPASVESVQIYGEWYFSQASSIVSQTTADMRMGRDWLPGDVLAGYNNAWRAVPMAKGADGIWEFTSPLPSGTFSYRYYHDCAAVNGSGCQALVDPANVPWSNDPAVAAQGAGQQALSQVYVPGSAEFPTYDNAFQAPAPASAKGTVRSFWYYPPGASGPGASRNATVYLPAGYDPDRATPYPTFYISHGGGGNDTDWMTQGQIQNIADNAIRDGQAQPMVVVAPNANGIAGGNAGYAADLRDGLIPAVESAFNVSREAEDRAFGGLSMGGGRAIVLLHEYTDLFGYYALWSAAGAYAEPAPEQVAKIKQVLGLQIGTGLQDFLGSIGAETLKRIDGYRALGIEVTEANLPGIHSWDVWRHQADAFIRDTAFKTTRVEVLAASEATAGLPIALTAKVTAAGSTAAAPTGQVEFRAGTPGAAGESLGTAQLDANGTAALTGIVRQSGEVEITAAYGGDATHNSASASRTLAVAAGPDNPLRLGPAVRHTGAAPTGYELTLRYQAPPEVEQAYVYAEWSFAQPAAIRGVSDADIHLGDGWAPGDVPANAGAWPTVPMTKGADGVWSFTTPLPSGVFSYGFTNDCTGGAGCARLADPVNPPWSNTAEMAAAGAAAQTMSQVYVPFDAAHQTADQSYLAPLSGAAAGTMESWSYFSPASTDPPGSHQLAVWLPPGYDANRAAPYPTLYISHGGSGTETDWTTQGLAQNILGNMIRAGQIQPMVLVATNFNGLPDGNEGFAAEIRDRVIPAVQARYNVSLRREDRAYGGLSAGAGRGITLVQDHTDLFGYYGLWSSGDLFAQPSAEQLARMRTVYGLHTGSGLQDYRPDPPARFERAQQRIDAWRAGGVDVTEYFVDGIHSWDVWRQSLHDFLARVA
ncbi:MAG: Ig-like domain repeat protein, partial [Bifidobacteriaceae bacterium]|nr:Ig-like domain repeat protein [Bifidobacteriaceae bacterium]